MRNTPPAPAANGHATGAAAAADPALVLTAAVLPLLLSLQQAAVLLGTSERTLKRACAEQALPPGAVVRPFGKRRLFNRAVLERWVEQGCPRPRVTAGRR
jgi:excisionase family DNA binding protein